MEIPVGSLVVPSPRYREAMGTGEGAAVLLALQRGNGNLYYPGPDRGFWVPMREVRSIPPGAVEDGSRERLLSELILFLEADECAIEAGSADGLSLRLEVAGLSREDFEGLRQWLGDLLVDYGFEAGSMRAMVCRLVLAGLPQSAGEGR